MADEVGCHDDMQILSREWKRSILCAYSDLYLLGASCTSKLLHFFWLSNKAYAKSSLHLFRIPVWPSQYIVSKNSYCFYLLGEFAEVFSKWSDASKLLICIVQRVHFQVRAGNSCCRQRFFWPGFSCWDAARTKLRKVNADRLINIMCVSSTLRSFRLRKWNRQVVLRTQPIKSKSLFGLIGGQFV